MPRTSLISCKLPLERKRREGVWRIRQRLEKRPGRKPQPLLNAADIRQAPCLPLQRYLSAHTAALYPLTQMSLDGSVGSARASERTLRRLWHQRLDAWWNLHMSPLFDASEPTFRPPDLNETDLTRFGGVAARAGIGS